MLISDGECPNCGAPQLHLNTSDLLECPVCRLVCAGFPVVATVMPFLGDGKFRLTDGEVASLSGVCFAKAKNRSVLPDPNSIFQSQQDLADYLATLNTMTSNK